MLETDPLLLFHDSEFRRIQKARQIDPANESWYVALIQAEIEDRQHRLKALSRRETQKTGGKHRV